MSQIARAVSDVFNYGWTPSIVFSQIDEETPDDNDAVASQDNPVPNAFEVKLSALEWPHPGPQTLTVRLKKTSSDPLDVSIILLQGSTVIAARGAQPTEQFENYAFPLTDQEIQAITDYTNLRLRILVGDVQTGCCPNLLPSVLDLAISNTTSGCVSPGVTKLYYNPSSERWEGSTLCNVGGILMAVSRSMRPTAARCCHIGTRQGTNCWCKAGWPTASTSHKSSAARHKTAARPPNASFTSTMIPAIRCRC